MKFKLTLVEMLFLGLMGALNIGLSLLLAPIFKALLTHIITGLFIMVPLNFLLFRIASRMVPKMGALTLYLFIFGLLSFATPLFGEGTGIIKVGLATAIGFTLDLLISSTKKLNTMLQILLFGGLGAFAWWLLTFSVWSLYGFPFVHAFANMLNSVIPLEGWISLPFADFSLDWFKFAAFCGFFSSIPVIIATVFGEKIAEQLQSTVVYQKFAELQNPET